MLDRLIAFLRSRPFRPDVVIFTRDYRLDCHALQFRRQRPASVFCRRRGPLPPRSGIPGQREERKPKGGR